MKVSLRWLKDYLDLSVSTEELLERLTLGGTEVESVQHLGVTDPNVVVAEVLSYVPHPNADRLRLCQVSIGAEQRQIVCGAKNFEVGSRVALALPGAELPGGFKIKESKLRGELSQGMMCSARELGLAEDAEGLLLLSNDAPLGKKLGEVIPADVLFEIEVTPNRPDLLSYLGLAREIAALGGGTLKPMLSPTLAWPNSLCAWPIMLEETHACPFYTATLLTDVKVGASPAWLKEKIAATGHRSINNVVDITNFVLWETGQPLHAFDADQLTGPSLSVRRARAGEMFAALDDKTYALTAEDFVIADAGRPQALAGVMGGKLSGVSSATRTVVLESAWFAPNAVRASSRRHGLFSDSSYRFERRVDPLGVVAARDRAIALLQEWAEAKLTTAPILLGQIPAGRGPIRLRTTRIEKVLGVTMPEAEVAEGLTRFGLSLVSQEAEASTWQPPSFRYDLEEEIDLIEELARRRGLAGVPARLRTGWARESAADRMHQKELRLRQGLAARGWQECLSDALLDEAALGGRAALKLLNPLTAQYTHLRPDLCASLLQATAFNLAQGNTMLHLFELGRVYGEQAGKVVESTRLGLLVAGQAGGLHWAETERAVDFYDVKGVADYLENQLGVAVAQRVSFGAVEAETLKRHGIKAKVYYAEYALDHWLALENAPARLVRLPSFPPVRRDVALVMARTISHATVLEAMRDAKMPSLEKIDLFDVFTDDDGTKIAADKKSLAYALTYRAQDRTLTDKEVNVWHEQLLAKLKAALPCEVRAT